MRFTLKTDDLAKGLNGAEGDVARSVTSAMREVTEGLKTELRTAVVDAGLGQRLANTWRGKTYPEGGISLEAASFVWSKAPNIVDAFDRGVTIKSSRGLWLAIPTPAAGVKGVSATGAMKRITPGGWERRTGMRLRFVYRRGRPSLLVADNARLSKKGLAKPNIGRTRAGAVHAAERAHHRRGVHPGPAGHLKEAARHRPDRATMGRPRAGRDRPSLEMKVNQERVAVFAALLSFAFVIAILVTGLR